jgi:RHS repeat-associated protein
VIEQQQTAPFGELMTDTGYGTNFKFTSYERDGETRSDYALNRQYAASTARFNQADPYDGSYDATGPQSLNRYSYTQNDPANLIDPTGLVWACWLLYQGREYGYVIICIDAGDPVIFPSEGKPCGGGGQRGTQQKQQQKPKCKQSKNGGDRPDIEAKLEAAGVSSNISNIRSALVRKVPKGFYLTSITVRPSSVRLRARRSSHKTFPSNTSTRLAATLLILLVLGPSVVLAMADWALIAQGSREVCRLLWDRRVQFRTILTLLQPRVTQI